MRTTCTWTMKDDISTPTSDSTGSIANSDTRTPQAREKWLAGQSGAFKAAVNGAPLEESLGILIQTAIDQVGADRCAFYIANGEGTELKHVVGMPEDYARKVDGFVIGKESLACGLAAGTARPVITPDVREEPRWQRWLWLAQEYGYRDCWSFPVDNSQGRPVGTFAMYFAKPRDATSEDLAFAHSLVATASIIIVQSESQSALREIQRLQSAIAVSERDQKRLLAERQHRVRNTLAVVRSIARRTAERSEDVDGMLSHFESRLNAFSRVQAAGTGSPGQGVELRRIVDDELMAVATREGSHLRIKGPDICLKARVAESMSLAIHELATNAVKYGALSADKGRIRVNWEVTRNGVGDELRFDWIETGLDSPPTVSHEGFGHEMLLRSLPYDLGAETSIEFKRDGMRFSMNMPVGPDTLADPVK